MMKLHQFTIYTAAKKTGPPFEPIEAVDPMENLKVEIGTVRP